MKWVAINSIGFTGIYAFCNWQASLRNDVHHLYLTAELSIPLIPDFILAYLSIYGLFFLPIIFLDKHQIDKLGKQLLLGTIVAAMVFVLYPTQLGFTRTGPESGIFLSVYKWMFILDRPYNMAPSLHVTYATIITSSLFEAIKQFSLRCFGTIWLIIICLSTILVHQHHLIDIATGLLLAFLVTRNTWTRNTWIKNIPA